MVADHHARNAILRPSPEGNDEMRLGANKTGLQLSSMTGEIFRLPFARTLGIV